MNVVFILPPVCLIAWLVAPLQLTPNYNTWAPTGNTSEMLWTLSLNFGQACLIQNGYLECNALVIQ